MGDYAWQQQILRNEMDWIPITHQRHCHTQTNASVSVPLRFVGVGENGEHLHREKQTNMRRVSQTGTCEAAST